jgi:hypothetical protein
MDVPGRNLQHLLREFVAIHFGHGDIRDKQVSWLVRTSSAVKAGAQPGSRAFSAAAFFDQPENLWIIVHDQHGR